MYEKVSFSLEFYVYEGRLRIILRNIVDLTILNNYNFMKPVFDFAVGSNI